MADFTWDGWEAFIFIGYCLFFARHLAQWWASEQEGRPIIPIVFWWFSIALGNRCL